MTAARPEVAAETTDDAFLGGRLMLLQPKSGFRAGLDAVLLAAAVPAEAGRCDRVLDAGAGVGTAGLAVAARVPDAKVVLVEVVPGLAALARDNVARNGLSERVRAIEADLCAPAAKLAAVGLEPQSFDHVLANPPFLEEGRSRPPADPATAGACVMAAGGLDRWVRFLARMAASGGTLTLIHRTEALRELLTALDGRFGALEILPIHPRKGSPAHRVLVSGRKASRAAPRLHLGLILHGSGNGFLPEVERILRDGAPLPLGDRG